MDVIAEPMPKGRCKNDNSFYVYAHVIKSAFPFQNDSKAGNSDSKKGVWQSGKGVSSFICDEL